MSNKFASTEARVAHLERVCGIQQEMLDRLHVAILGHQYGIELLALAVGVELQPQPAQAAPMTSLN